ncbi:MAG: Lrp/AsnC family transcriptional regulator [Candidatus Bathyarchaeia archaeon]
MSIDDVDLRILAELVENSKVPFTDIGKNLSIHPNVVAYRVRRMEQAGIIKKYTVLLDLEKLGLSEHICVSANFPGFTERDDLIKEIASIPQIFRLFSTLGDPGLMIFILGKNKTEINEIISRIRKLDINIEATSPIVKVYQDWLQGCFLQNLTERNGQTGRSPNKPAAASNGDIAYVLDR